MEKTVAKAVKALEPDAALGAACPFCGADVDQSCMVPAEHLPRRAKARRAKGIHEARQVAFVVLTGRNHR